MKTTLPPAPTVPEEDPEDSAFEARAEAAYQHYKRTGISYPIDEVFDRLIARIEARRREITG